MSQTPAVSVLMAVYNSEKYLVKSIDSILTQSFSNFEFIIINDGSTDKSLEVLEDYAAKDKRICLSSRENRGVAKTRNELIQKATGDYIAVMDSDDIALPNRLEQQVEFLQTYPDFICVGGAFELIDAKDRLITCIKPPLDNETLQKLMLLGHTAIHHACAMIRRSSLIQIGGYLETMATVGDLDLFLRLGEVGKLANLNVPLFKYRLHLKSISHKKQLQQIEDKRKACQQAWQRRGIQGHFEAEKPWTPGTDRASFYHFMLKYGWWAFNSYQRQTAIVYAFKAIQVQPRKINGWKLLVCALFKDLPTPDCSKEGY